jgi:hypothetical protein
VNSGIGDLPFWSSGVPGSDGDCSVWLQTTLGFGGSNRKSTLCEPWFVSGEIGDVNVTVPPAVIWTVLSEAGLPTSWK